MKNKPETVTGNLFKENGKWYVRHGYGKPAKLSESLQSKPADESAEALVEATVQMDIVIDYHFI